MLQKSISYILPFSAKSREALDRTSAQVIRYLKEHQQIELADASWTLQKGRRAFEYRKTLVASKNDLESDTFHVCSNADRNGKGKQNLVLVLPDVQDAIDVWKSEETMGSNYPVLKSYERAAQQILEMLPESKAEQVRTGSADVEVNCYRAFIS